MSELQWYAMNPGTCGSCGTVCAERVTIQEANVDPGHYCDECAQKEVAARNSPRRRFARQLIAEAMEGAQDAQRTLHAAADVQVRMLHAVGISLESLTFVAGHPVTGVGVLPAIRHEVTGRDLVTFHWHEEARAWSVMCDDPAITALADPKPPTLREWLGPENVAELGEWADVLREQPAPAGHIRRIVLDRSPNGSWSLLLNGLGRVSAHEVVYRLTRPPILRQQIDEALQMALFARHPAVPPEPAPLRTWFGNEEEP